MTRLGLAAVCIAILSSTALAASVVRSEPPFPNWLLYIANHPYAQYAAIGFCMGLLRDAIKNGGALRIPRIDCMPDGAKLFRLGSLLAPFAGVAAACLADHHAVTAALAGWVGPDGIEALLNAPAAARKRKNGR